MKYSYNNKEVFPRVEVYHDIIPYMADVKMKDFFMDKQKCVYAWKTSTAKLKEYYGDMFPMRKPAPAPISYGHLMSIGATVLFPDDGEPNILPFAESIDEAIEILKKIKGADMTKTRWFQHYFEMWEYMKAKFPNENIPFSGFGSQGPVTSAILMRGQDFLLDIYDEPEKSLEFLSLITDSSIDFVKLTRRINNQPEVQPHAGMVDDHASLIPPDMWNKFVIPFWEQRFNALYTGTSRSVHVENLYPAHLSYLKEAKVTHYQPSVSDFITLEIIKDKLDPSISIDWLLYAYHITDMSDEEIQEWVDKTVEWGVSEVRTQFGAYAYQIGKLDRIKAFMKAFDKYKI